jgi:hypothetical protein
MHSRTIYLISFIGLALLVGVAAADTGIFNVPETQGFSTGTTMQAVGTVTESDVMVWAISGIVEVVAGPQPDQHINYTTSDSEDTIADQGLVSYVKSASIDTSEQAVGQDNFRTSKVVEFVGLDTGRMISAENEVIDGASTGFNEADEDFICPFIAPANSWVPAFCNIEEMGSSVDLTLGSLSTDTGEHFMGFSADPGVTMDYSVKLTGFGDVPAMGSAEAYINVHSQEARDAYSTALNGQLGADGDITSRKAADLVYSESTTAAGDITLFQKVMGYDSKVTGTLPVTRRQF